MKMTKIYLYARAIHRFLVIIVTVLTLIMTGTGLILRQASEGKNLPARIDVNLARYIHNQISVFFTIVLICMALSGIVMYLYPLIKKK